MGDLKHLLSLALHLMEFMLEKQFYFDQHNFYAFFFYFIFLILAKFHFPL